MFSGYMIFESGKCMGAEYGLVHNFDLNSTLWPLDIPRRIFDVGNCLDYDHHRKENTRHVSLCYELIPKNDL